MNDDTNGSDGESPAETGSEPDSTAGQPRARSSADGPAPDDVSGPDSGRDEGPGEGQGARSAEDKARDPDYRPSPSDPFEVLWAHLSQNQRKYVLARQSHTKKAYAAEAVDLHRDTVYDWPEYVEAASRKLVDKQKDEIAYALQKLEHKGIRELERLLDEGNDERTVLEAVRTIFNRNRGKPTKKTEVEHSGGIDLDPGDEDAIDDALSHLGGSDESDG